VSIINQAEARRLEALRLAMTSIVRFLDDPDAIEIALNADGTIWVECVGRGAPAVEASRPSGAPTRP
jgi:hypothetical protein